MRRPPSVNSGPPYISDSIRARKLELKMQLDIVKYTIWVFKKISASGAQVAQGHYVIFM